MCCTEKGKGKERAAPERIHKLSARGQEWGASFIVSTRQGGGGAVSGGGGG